MIAQGQAHLVGLRVVMLLLEARPRKNWRKVGNIPAGDMGVQTAEYVASPKRLAVVDPRLPDMAKF